MNRQQIIQERTFNVGEYPGVSIDNYAGDISVYGGTAEIVGIQVSIEPGSGGAMPTVEMQCVDGKHVIIKVSRDSNIIGKTASVNFAVTVPHSVDLDLHTSAGNTEVMHVYGQVKLHSHAGSISASATTLAGKASMQTNAGSITFAGSIDPRANYHFQTNTGSVDITLPGNSTFHVDAKTDVGGLTIDFPTMQVIRKVVGGEAHGDTGNSPRAQLSLHSNVGSIALHQGPAV